MGGVLLKFRAALASEVEATLHHLHLPARQSTTGRTRVQIARQFLAFFVGNYF